MKKISYGVLVFLLSLSITSFVAFPMAAQALTQVVSSLSPSKITKKVAPEVAKSLHKNTQGKDVILLGVVTSIMGSDMKVLVDNNQQAKNVSTNSKIVAKNVSKVSTAPTFAVGSSDLDGKNIIVHTSTIDTPKFVPEIGSDATNTSKIRRASVPLIKARTAETISTTTLKAFAKNKVNASANSKIGTVGLNGDITVGTHVIILGKLSSDGTVTSTQIHTFPTTPVQKRNSN